MINDVSNSESWALPTSLPVVVGVDGFNGGGRTEQIPPWLSAAVCRAVFVGQVTRTLERVAVDVETSIEIDAPRDRVAAFASDPENAPRWYVNISSVAWETPPPATVGSRIAFVAHFLGRRIAYTYEVRELMDSERFVMSTAEGPFPMKTTYTWADIPGGGTRMTLRNQGEPSGFGKLTAPVMAGAMSRANRKDLEALKALLEKPNR